MRILKHSRSSSKTLSQSHDPDINFLGAGVLTIRVSDPATMTGSFVVSFTVQELMTMIMELPIREVFEIATPSDTKTFFSVADAIRSAKR